jgi:hypothetical protein
MSRKGDMLVFERARGRVASGMDTWHPAGSRPADAPRGIEAIEERPLMVSSSLSPDGKTIVAVTPSQGFAISDENGTRIVDTKWTTSGPYSWAPDIGRVAFYYTPSARLPYDDVHVQKHGVALLTVGGELRAVVSVSDSFGTPDSSAKYVAPGWSPSGRYVYYTAGVAPDDPLRASEAVRVLRAVTVTCRVDVETGQVERLATGDFACVSPDGTYVLVYPCPKQAADGKWTTATAKIDLQTRELEYLPDGIDYPLMSPSGKLVACPPHRGNNGAIRFFETSNWALYGKPVPGVGTMIGVDHWLTDFRWIVKDSDPGAE